MKALEWTFHPVFSHDESKDEEIVLLSYYFKSFVEDHENNLRMFRGIMLPSARMHGRH